MKALGPYVMLAALACALLGVILLYASGPSPLSLGLLVGGLLASVAGGLRATTRGVDASAHGDAIRARARANWEMAKGKSQQ